MGERQQVWVPVFHLGVDPKVDRLQIDDIGDDAGDFNHHCVY